MASVDDDKERNNAWFDKVVTPLNACSLETYVPVTITNNNDAAVQEEIGRRRNDENNNEGVVPLVIGCYQLNEQSTSSEVSTSAATSAATDDDNVKPTCSSSSRSGELRLYMISPPPSKTPPSSSQSDNYGRSQQQLQAKKNDVIKFGNASCVVQMESGVLDGKWQRRRVVTKSTDQSIGPLFASASASGRIHLHSLENNNMNNNVDQQQEESSSWTLSHVTSSNQPDGEPICLSLAWNDFIVDTTTANNDVNTLREDQIVSSYSNGTVALHDVVHSTHNCSNSSNDGNNNNSNSSIISMEETHRWDAHSMFNCPSEVWTCSYLKGNPNIILSGADDCTFKSWDVRNTQRYIHKISNTEFESGVTAISSHPTLHNIFAVGSYDEYVRVYDYRKINEPMAKVHVGGGVWRIKWHPSCWKDDTNASASSDDRRNDNSGKMLVAAMHGGCRIVNLLGLEANNGDANDNNNDIKILSRFTAHESMAYGADWISLGKEEQEAVAASCSFYDRQAFLWGPDNNTI